MKLNKWLLLSKKQKMDLIKKEARNFQIFVDELQSLEDNMHLVDTFLYEAHKVARVRSHYSVRTIFEVMRHNTMLEQKNSEYKISNDIIIPIGRVSLLFPALEGLFNFKTRSTK